MIATGVLHASGSAMHPRRFPRFAAPPISTPSLFCVTPLPLSVGGSLLPKMFTTGTAYPLSIRGRSLHQKVHRLEVVPLDLQV
jgi:hypothetical protein